MGFVIRSACRSAACLSRSAVSTPLLSTQFSQIRFYAITKTPPTAISNKASSIPPPTVFPPKDGNTNSPDDKVLMLEVKKKVLELLEKEGPMSRRKMYDDHLAQIFPTAPFAPNPPRGRCGYGRSIHLTKKGKVRHLLAEIDESEKAEEVLYRKQKMEQLVASESDKNFVWILDSWITTLKQKSLERSQREAHLLGHTAPTRFKRA
ncbi:hypothetical protein PCANC_09060 [Puccinia coronata f. sp. avenae]|uniref:Uncharacterized protein n=1 Tax=Puccinia coronata f. sp. avenae TaxID=200324 RepID=A0A2N5T245_9BASI|nr:hypothetical protein PCANC_09060 [Puccinia coronata f. sp. avenae]